MNRYLAHIVRELLLDSTNLCWAIRSIRIMRNNKIPIIILVATIVSILFPWYNFHVNVGNHAIATPSS